MANNYDVGGSGVAGGGGDCSRNLSNEEAHALCEARLLVPPDWHLPSE
jgi:hypothetical protein